MKTDIPKDLPDENPEFLQSDESVLDGEIVWIEATQRCKTPQAAINWFWQFADWMDFRWEIQDFEVQEGQPLAPSVANDGQVEWLTPYINRNGNYKPVEDKSELDRISDFYDSQWHPSESTDEDFAKPFFKVVMF